MEAYNAFVKRVITAFDGSRLDFAFTGALAISYYGIPRTTSDIDVMVVVTDEQDTRKALSTVLKNADLVVDAKKINDALSSGFRIASFKDKNSPYTLDVILSSEKIKKRVGTVAGLETYLQSPEGLIAAKLRMIKATVPPERCAKDKKDIEAILHFTKVDLGAVKKQSKKDKTLSVFDALGLTA